MSIVSSRPLSSHLGAEILGVDLHEQLSPQQAEEIRTLFYRHRLLLFADQLFSAEDQIRFMTIIGNVIAEDSDGRFTWVTNKATAQEAYVGGAEKLAWHADFSFTPQGPLHALSLYATQLEIPEPTTYANMVRAAANLPAELRSRLEPLRVVQLLDFSKEASSARRNRLSALRDTPPEQYSFSEHRLIERHPVTGEEYLTVSDFMSSHICGWSDAASDELFGELGAIAYADDNTHRREWQLHDFVVWDNVALQHSREAFAMTAPRVLRRVAVNPVDVPTLLTSVRPDPVAHAGQWHKTE